MIMHYEIWRPVKGYEGLYEVSNYGRVKSLPRKYTKGGILSYCFTKFGYPMVILSKDGKCRNICVHRLVAEAFLPNPDNLPVVNHKDENPSNNYVHINQDGTVDPSKSNLEWCDYSYNLCYGGALGRMIQTRNRKGAYGSEKPIIQYTVNGEFVRFYKSISEAARVFGRRSVEVGINMVLKGKRKTAYGFKWGYA